MTKEQLAPWIEKLTTAPDGELRAVFSEMRKENGLKTGDARRLLKEAGFDLKAALSGDETQPDGDTPDSTGADSADRRGDGPPPGPSAPGEKPAKIRVRHEALKGGKLIVGDKTVEFDADGIAELDAADAERLLTIPGYTEVKE